MMKIYKIRSDDFHKIANKKMKLFKNKRHDNLKDLVEKWVLGEKIPVFIPLNNRKKINRFDTIKGEVFKRTIRFCKKEKEYYIFANNKKYYVKPKAELIFNVEDPYLYEWTAYNY